MVFRGLTMPFRKQEMNLPSESGPITLREKIRARWDAFEFSYHPAYYFLAILIAISVLIPPSMWPDIKWRALYLVLVMFTTMSGVGLVFSFIFSFERYSPHSTKKNIKFLFNVMVTALLVFVFSMSGLRMVDPLATAEKEAEEKANNEADSLSKER